MSPLLPRLLAERPGLSQGAREYRQLMWLMVVLGAAGFVVGVGAVRGSIAPSIGTLGFVVGVGALGLAAWFGLQVRARTLADREREAAGALTVLLAAQLRDRDEAELVEMVRRGGSVGEAAALILQGRKERRRPS
jgi:Zn-dependent alcohol dehydrogenase